MWAIKRGEHANVDQTSGSAIEAIACPNAAPTIFNDQILQRFGQFIDGGQRTVDVGVAQNFAPSFYAPFVLIVIQWIEPL